MASPMQTTSTFQNQRFFGGKTKRPIDKQIINVGFGAVTATQETVTLSTVAFPCTLTGVRTDITTRQNAGTTPGTYGWVLVVVPDGTTISQIAFTNGSSVYQPEQNVLMWGRGVGNRASEDNPHTIYRDVTKTMRKLKVGDKFVFAVKGEATNTSDFDGAVQFFCKS